MHIIQTINSFLWDFFLLFALCGTGIFFTFKLKFIQVTRFKDSFKATFGNIKLKGQQTNDGTMSSFQSLATSIAAQVGTGNLAGAASAIIYGGPGAIFWMWVSAFFGMATIFAEATLAQKYKTIINGKVTGGPVYYIKAAFKGKFGKILAAAFAIFIIIALGFMGNMVQSNSIGNAFFNAFGINPIYIGIFISIASAFVFLGGISRLASVTEKIVPIMALLYIIGSIILLIMNFDSIGFAFKQIFIGAFNPQAIMGAGIGIGVRQAIRYGVARGLFSNEAGMGSTPHAHAVANVKNPCDQGIVAMMGVFIDTFVILTMTALVIISSDVLSTGISGVELTQLAFSKTFGSFGTAFIAICLLFFAFSTIISWYFFGLANVKYLFGKKAVKLYSILVVIAVFIGSILKVDLVWELSDMFNGLMVIPNLLALLFLAPQVSKLYNNYKNRL